MAIFDAVLDVFELEKGFFDWTAVDGFFVRVGSSAVLMMVCDLSELVFDEL